MPEIAPACVSRKIAQDVSGKYAPNFHQKMHAILSPESRMEEWIFWHVLVILQKVQVTYPERKCDSFGKANYSIEKANPVHQKMYACLCMKECQSCQGNVRPDCAGKLVLNSLERVSDFARNKIGPAPRGAGVRIGFDW